MKIPLLGLIVLLGTAATMRAELQFPVYASLTPSQQYAWGYAVEENGRAFLLTIPARTAKLYRGNRVFLYNENDTREVRLSPWPGKDGELAFRFTRPDGCRRVRLVIQTDLPPRLSTAEWTNKYISFGGLTFETGNADPVK